MAAFNNSSTTIRDMLRDDDTATRFGFSPVIVSQQAVSKKMSKFTPDEINEERKRFLEDFTDTPLAFKKVRVKELCDIYKKLVNDPIAYGKGVVKARLQVLRDIKAEIGEDIEKLADALRHNGDQHLTFNFGALSDDERDRIRREVDSLWSPASNRF